MGIARGRLAAALLLGLAVFAAPADAQPQAKTARIGYAWLGPAGSDTAALDGLKRGLAELGYIEGRNLVIEYRYADGRPERLPIVLAALVTLKVDLLVTPGTIVTRAAQQATTAMPIVSTSTDPVGSGFAKSLARPGGNITGLSLATGDDFNGKWLDLIKELEPKVKRIAYLWNPGSASSVEELASLKRLAPRLRVEIEAFGVGEADQLGAALEAIRASRAGALLVDDDPLLFAARARIVAFAARHRLLAVYEIREFVDAGGLISYGPSIADIHRRAAGYADRILKGAKPADMPIEQPTTFELVLNLKTAKAMGLTIPPSLGSRVDQVIK
jgi:putative tryptophan/tyrosine transport system substrate-binding protein